jgi:hypothetical protein
MKIRTVVADLFRADRQRDMVKQIITSRSFAKALKTANGDAVWRSAIDLLQTGN